MLFVGAAMTREEDRFTVDERHAGAGMAKACDIGFFRGPAARADGERDALCS
jgi:hypothetical protein